MSHRVVLSLLIASCLVAAGCGSSSGGSGEPAGGSSSAALPASSAPVATPPLTIASSSTAAAGPSVEQPCSFITAAEMSALLHATATVQDDGFRCKYVVGTGWLEVELTEFSSASAASIWDYDKAHGAAVPGVGDEAYIFGAAIVVKLGDVFIDVNGDELPQPPDDATLKAIAQKIVGQIP